MKISSGLARCPRGMTMLALLLLLAACGGDSTQPRVATALAFTVQPAAAVAGAPFTTSIVVEIQDGSGGRMTQATNVVTISIAANPAAGTLAGTRTLDAVAGRATFTNLSIDNRGRGYTLLASSGSLTAATSAPFGVVTPASFPLLAPGGGHSCAFDNGGFVHCWGQNADGQLGVGTTAASALPLALQGLVIASLSVGENHTCAVTSTGSAYCWGSNTSGQVGDGTQGNSRSLPVAVTGGHTFARVSAGGSHTCGVTTPPESAVYCWGANNHGQLGDSTLTGRTSPVIVSGGLTFSAVSAGASHTCAMALTGGAWCWGENAQGQLGDSSTTPRSYPAPVLGDPGLQEVYAGNAHSCGITPAAGAYCWGDNSHGQLGDSSTTQRTAPVAVAGGVGFGVISPGFQHTCGMATTQTLYCWGKNSQGQLGDGTTTDRSSPVAVAGGLTPMGILSGHDHTCAWTSDGGNYCWGANTYGGLGNGTTTNSSVPVKVLD